MEILQHSKLGFHIDILTYPGQIEKMIEARPATIKVISSMGTLNVLHDALPDTVFIARDWIKDQNGGLVDDFLRFGAETTNDMGMLAVKWMNAMRPSIVQAPFAYWEAFNEMSHWDSVKKYGDFEAERQFLMNSEGFRCCIGNFATGTPEITDQGDQWYGFYPALAAAHQFKNVLGLHEYGGLWMDLWYGPNQSEALRSGNRVPLPEDIYEGWLFGRYRKLHRKHLEPNGWLAVRIVLNECGLDMAGTVDTSLLAGYTVGSWTTCGPAWSRIDGRNDSAQYYVEQLQWTDRQMQKDAYMIGSNIFTWGTVGELWRDFEIEGDVATKLVSYLKTTQEKILDFHLFWPTDYAYVTQPFGVNPQNYAQFGLPGHEGLDIRAPHRARVYACAPGTVSKAYFGGAYGNQIRIQHVDGYETIYAHLDERLVEAGDEVLTGQLIGYADNTGNSFGSHLHITLKHEGATANGETNYPSDIIDPTPFMTKDNGTCRVTTTAAGGQWVRMGADKSYRAVSRVDASFMVSLLKETDSVKIGSDTWVEVRVPSGIKGWMYAKYLRKVV